MLAGIEDRDLGGEVLRLQDDGGCEVGERTVVGHFPLGLHRLGAAAEQGLVALAADEREVVVAAGLLVDDGRQFLLRFAQFFAGLNPFGVQQPLLDDFGPAGLDGEVGLGEGDLLLSGITVLGDEVAGIAGEQDVLHLPGAARAERHHFVGVNKMVGDAMSADVTGCFGLGDDRREVAPLLVPEQVLQVARQPVFDAGLGLLGVGLEGGRQGLDGVGIHASRISATLRAMVSSSSRAWTFRVWSSSLRVESCSLKSSSLTASPGATPT